MKFPLSRGAKHASAANSAEAPTPSSASAAFIREVGWKLLALTLAGSCGVLIGVIFQLCTATVWGFAS